jgi:glycosyltransferase involved in cell wall biosynthesis
VGATVHGMGPALGRYAFNPKTRDGWTQMRALRCIVIHGVWQHSALAGARSARAAGIPYVVYAHGALDQPSQRLYPRRHLKKLVYWRLFGRALMERAAAVCFATPQEKERATAYQARYSGVVVGSGVAPPPLTDRGLGGPRKQTSRGCRAGRVLVFIGRLDPIKGLDVLIRAFAGVVKDHEGVRLLIVGRGEPRTARRWKRSRGRRSASDHIIGRAPCRAPKNGRRCVSSDL